MLTARRQAPVALFVPVLLAGALSVASAVLYITREHSARFFDLALLFCTMAILLAGRVQTAWRRGGGKTQFERRAEELRTRIEKGR